VLLVRSLVLRRGKARPAGGNGKQARGTDLLYTRPAFEERLIARVTRELGISEETEAVIRFSHRLRWTLRTRSEPELVIVPRDGGRESKPKELS
jgi:hypothetical protein